MLRYRWWLLLLALPWMWTGQALSQTKTAASGSAPDGQVVFQANARTVIVDVVVTTRSGSPVAGLHKDAFQVSEKGQPQPITFFEEHTGAQKPAKAPMPPLPPNVFCNYSATPLPDSVNVLLLDSLNTPLQEQSFVHEQAVNFLKRLPRGSRLAIFGMSENLTFVQGFTSDPALLMAALGNRKLAGVRPSPLLKTHAEEAADDQLIAQMENMNTGSGAGSLQASINSMRQFLADRSAFEGDQRVTMTLENLQQLARFLRGVPGRKNVIWMSGAFPLSIFPDANLSDPITVMRQYEEQVRDTADLLTAARVALYPVDAFGLQVSNFYSAENGPVGAGNIESQRQATFLARESVERNSMHTTMDVMARDTGGRAFYNTNGLADAIDTAVTSGAHFYTLAYTPSNQEMDGRYRRIEVKVPGGGYTLSYRRGYYAEEERTTKTTRKGMPSEPLRPFMGFAMPNFDQILYKVLVKPAKQPQKPGTAGNNEHLTGPLIRYSVDFAVVVQDLHLAADADGTRRGTVNLAISVYDRYGDLVNWKSKAIEMEIKPYAYNAFLQQGLQLPEEIDVPKGQQLWLRTGVYDAATRRVGTLEIPLSAVHEEAAQAAGK